MYYIIGLPEYQKAPTLELLSKERSRRRSMLSSFIEVYGGSVRGMGYSIISMLIIVSNICVLRVALLAVLSVTPGTVRAVAAVYPMTWGGAAVCFIAAFLWIIGKKLKTQ